jgi:hypothetical protein
MHAAHMCVVMSRLQGRLFSATLSEGARGSQARVFGFCRQERCALRHTAHCESTVPENGQVLNGRDLLFFVFLDGTFLSRMNECVCGSQARVCVSADRSTVL